MTENLFVIESERINSTYSIRILKGKEVIFEVSNWDSLSTMHKRECEDIVDLLNELSEREEQLLSEIDDFQELLSEKDNICLDKVINAIEDKLAFLYGAKGDLINEDSYRLEQISFAINVLRELKKELKGDDE